MYQWLNSSCTVCWHNACDSKVAHLLRNTGNNLVQERSWNLFIWIVCFNFDCCFRHKVRFETGLVLKWAIPTRKMFYQFFSSISLTYLSYGAKFIFLSSESFEKIKKIFVSVNHLNKIAPCVCSLRSVGFKKMIRTLDICA